MDGVTGLCSRLAAQRAQFKAYAKGDTRPVTETRNALSSGLDVVSVTTINTTTITNTTTTITTTIIRFLHVVPFPKIKCKSCIR